MRIVPRVLAVTALASGGLILTAGSAGAADGQQVFAPTGTMQSFTVPTNVCAVTVLAQGAPGGGGAPQEGEGGVAEATVPVTPNETLQVFVGGAGGDGGSDINDSIGGFPDGGDGGISPNAGPSYSPSGGGSSSVRRAGTPLVVAGGGGATASGFDGGDGGGGTGGDGGMLFGAEDGKSGTGGSAGGPGGNGGALGDGADEDGFAGGPGGSFDGGDGGDGGGPMADNGIGGGGGGGGYFGGGGGGGGAGGPNTPDGAGFGGSGGGGAGFAAANATGVTLTQGGSTIAGLSISWTEGVGCSSPPVCPAGASLGSSGLPGPQILMVGAPLGVYLLWQRRREHDGRGSSTRVRSMLVRVAVAGATVAALAACAPFKAPPGC